MSDSELEKLASNISANGLREPLTLTPQGELLDGRNRDAGCLIAGVKPTTVVHDGDPWAFSISVNAHRRHMPVDAVAMIVAQMLAARAAGSNEPPPTVVEAAKAAGVPATAVKSARAVLKHGTEAEKTEARQKGGLRKAANKVRARAAPPRAPTRKTPKAPNAIAQTKKLVGELLADGQIHTIREVANTLQVADSAVKDELKDRGVAWDASGAFRKEPELALKTAEPDELQARLDSQAEALREKNRKIEVLEDKDRQNHKLWREQNGTLVSYEAKVDELIGVIARSQKWWTTWPGRRPANISTPPFATEEMLKMVEDATPRFPAHTPSFIRNMTISK
jgi:hypothetical protein